MKRFGMDYFIAAAMCAIIIFVMSSSAAAGIIYVKWNSPGTGAPPVYDGKSWDTAFHKVQDGINTSISGDDIWVAAGTYVECVVTKDGVALYGGFSGTEVSREQRNWRTNPTLIQIEDGGSTSGVGIRIPASAGVRTRVDGFVVTETRHPGQWDNNPGISCGRGGSPVIANNIVRNISSGLSCAISAGSGSPTIINNFVFNNGWDGVSCGPGGRVVGNTIAYNRGTGLFGESEGSLLFANNIVVFNREGVVALNEGGAPIIRNNCVYGNTHYDFLPGSAAPGTDGNISADPKFASTDYRDLHIQPDSPCIDAGDDSVLEPAWMDIDGQPRIQGAHVDIGADESDGTHCVEGPGKILRVTPTGNDANDGSAWDDAHAMKTIQCAVNGAFPWSGEVWVGAGEYRTGSTPSIFRMRDGVAVYGGFAGRERSRERRNWTANRTILPDGYVEIAVCPSPATRVDGMVLQGSGAPSPQPAIWANASASTISNNTITGYSGLFGAAIRTDGATFDRIVGNTITGNTGAYMIVCQYSPDDPVPPTTAPQSTAIIGNRILGNAASGVWIQLIYDCAHVIADNVIGNNEREGMYLYCSHLTITNNLVFGNGRAGIRFSPYTMAGDALMTNNTIVGNGLNPGGSTRAEGISISWPTKVTATNNIVAFNAVGISASPAAIMLGHNNVFGNVNGNYLGFKTDPTGTNGNISLDPLFRNAAVGDYHLLWNSPCVDAGTSIGAPPTDLDGNPRPIDGNMDGLAVTDMGAYELAPFQVNALVVPHWIHLQPREVILVVIPSTRTFNAGMIDAVSVLFGPGRAKEIHGKGHFIGKGCRMGPELLLHFRCGDTGIKDGDTSVPLCGRLTTGEPFTATAKIVVFGGRGRH